MKLKRLTRREFLHLTTVAAVGAAAAACGAPTPEFIDETPEAGGEVDKTVEATEKAPSTVEAPAGAAEPPLLAAKVEAGEIPPMAERLPATPAVVADRDAVGVYGGEVRMVHFETVWFTSEYGWNSDRFLHYSDVDLKTIIPNIFESWESSEDGTVWTIHMRKGLKWSDGVPLTTEDVEFWWNDKVLDPDLGGTPGREWRRGGENAVLEFLDDFTWRVTFSAPYGNFAAQLTRWHIGTEVILPKHYLKQFHAKYADEAELAAMIEDLGVENWMQVFNNKNGWGMTIWQGPENYAEYPSLSPWLIIDNPEEGLYLWERNPYYWKVDIEGNQLPYIDNLRIDYAASTEIVTMKIIQGELDYVGPHDVTIARYPLYKENEESSNYVVGDYLSCMIDRYVLFPQHNLVDKVLEEIVNHPNFVRALSVAIDREEINQSIYYGLARMGQMSPMPMSKYYKEEYGTAWAQYDPDLANQLLDEMGLEERDAEGFRLRPDGERLVFNIEHAGPRVGVSTQEFTEMVTTYWRELGIEATTKEEQESLYNERLANGEVHCGIWHADRCTDLLLHIEMRWYLPTNTGQGGAAQDWALWYSAADREAEDLVVPPPEIQQLYEWYDQMQMVVSEDERVALGQKIFDYLADKPLAIGSVLECPAPLLFNKALRNLPRPKVPVGWDSYGISTYHPEAFFFENGERA